MQIRRNPLQRWGTSHPFLPGRSLWGFSSGGGCVEFVPLQRNQEHNMNLVKPVSAVLAIALGLGITNLVATSMERSALPAVSDFQVAQLEAIVVVGHRAPAAHPAS